MEKNTAETIVKVYAILAWIGALLMLIAGLAMFVGPAFMGSFGMMRGFGAMGGLWTGAAVLFGILFLVLAVLYLFGGLGLWRHKEWARILTIVLSVLSLFSFPIGTIIGAIGIWLFGFEPTVKGLFGTAPVAAKAALAKKAKKK